MERNLGRIKLNSNHTVRRRGRETYAPLFNLYLSSGPVAVCGGEATRDGIGQSESSRRPLETNHRPSARGRIPRFIYRTDLNF